MDIRLLKQFVAVYEERSISRAAARSFVSQPALSNSMRQLEETLGCLLFNRSQQGVSPTTQAEQLYPMALHIIDDLNRIPTLFKKKQSTDTLKLAVMPELPQKNTAQLFRELTQIIPDTELTIANLGQSADARIILDVMKEENELFLPLWQERYVFCCHTQHPLASRTTIELRDLDNEPFIVCPPCEAHQRTLGLIGQQGMQVNIAASVESKHHVAMLLLAELGVSFLPEGMADEWPELIGIPLAGMSDKRQVGLAWSSNKTTSPALKAIIHSFNTISRPL